ncbi:MAG: transporter substrate-binding domain-containing protein [Planctomycetota bacterium]|jgi:polar amino acid transport system substrate-binding protein|nr:transporter substrate-binding domain-containing protein [Planctomycetota bacterium]
MKKYTLFFALTLACIAFGLQQAANPATAAENTGSIQSMQDLNGKRIGVLAGTILDDSINLEMDYTSITYFNNTSDEYKALSDGDIDAFVEDRSVAMFLVSEFPELKVLPENLTETYYGFATRYEDDDTYDTVNNALVKMMGDGTIEYLIKKWLQSPASERVLPPVKENPDALPLLVGVSSVSPPFAYTGTDNQVLGLDIELLQILTERINRRLVYTDMEFQDLIKSLLDKDVDVIGSCFSITESRAKLIHFTEGYFKDGASVITLNK